MNSTCTVADFKNWYNKPYDNDLSKSLLLVLYSTKREDDIWDVMNFENGRENFFSGATGAEITNGQLMEVSRILCRKSLSLLHLSLAGQHDTITAQSIHDVMCSVDCTLNDHLRAMAMNESRCSCIDLSPSQDDPGFKEEGSFCKENSGEYLCSDLGDCGVWHCALSDFGCKRNEFDQRKIPLRNECNVAPCKFNTKRILTIVITMIGFLFN